MKEITKRLRENFKNKLSSLSTKEAKALFNKINALDIDVKPKIKDMEQELNYLSELIAEEEQQITYYENESRKSESEDLRNHWTECIEIHTHYLEMLNNILSIVTAY